MPRYFCTIHRRDRIEDDPDGAYLPDVAASLSYAEYTIRGAASCVSRPFSSDFFSRSGSANSRATHTISLARL
jgi:hypothetical protein